MEQTTAFERSEETARIADPASSRGSLTQWALEIQDEEDVRRVPIGEQELVVGSSRGANIVVHDRTVSGKHCRVAVAHGGVLVRDLSSTNGTYVGGARVREALGNEGTTITIGQSTIVCVARAPFEHDGEIAEPLPGIVGSSIAMRRIAAQVRRLAGLSAPVLVTGETGVGKELVVRALHTEGPRRAGPFVPVNVAALPRELVESELFGHERGAFTGAVSRRTGAFLEAEGGTLFLDEIGELPVDAQPKLLRALDGYEIRRVGAGGAGRCPNARVVAATHVRLAESVERGTFRRDLFHRLEVFVIEVPPLRERPGDVAPIARAILAQMEPEIGRRELTASTIAQLTSHDWPGNVRELRNALSRAASLALGRCLDGAAMARAIRRCGGEERRASVLLTTPEARTLLERLDGNISAAAREANLPRTTFRKLLKLHER